MAETVNFNEYANKFDNYRSADHSLIDTLINMMGLSQDMHILDYGCGTGNYLAQLKAKGFTHLYGLDKSEEMCKISAEKTGLIVKCGDELHLPYENNFFDAVIIIDVLHFVKNLDVFLAQLNSIVKPGGEVFIATQSREQLKTRVYAKYFPSAYEIDKDRHHQINKIISLATTHEFSHYTVSGYKEKTDYIVDNNYLQLVRNKAFYIFGLIPEDEFEKGVAMLEQDLLGGPFVAKFPGRTLVLLKKDDERH